MDNKYVKLIIVSLLAMVLIGGGLQAAAAAEGEEDLVFGMIVKEPGTPFIEAFIKGAEEMGEELGVDVIIKDGQADSLKMINIMDNFIVQDVDGFIQAGAVDLQAIVPGIKRLNEADIPVMAIDTCPEGGEVELFISFDIEKASARATRAFVEGIKERNNGQVPEGVVVQITGSLQDMFAQACMSGFDQVISQYPQLEVVKGEGKWNNTDSHARTSDLLTRYGDEILGIYVHTPDIMGPGVVSAIKAAGKDPADYGICGICMGPEGKSLIESGDVRAIVAQPAYASAKLAVQYLYDLNHGKEIPQVGDTVVDEDALWSPAEVVDNPWADGAYMILQGPLVPLEVSTDDPRLWENRLSDLF